MFMEYIQWHYVTIISLIDGNKSYIFHLLTDRFHLLTCRFNLLTDRFNLLTYRFILLTNRFTLLTYRFTLLGDRLNLLTNRFIFIDIPIYLIDIPVYVFEFIYTLHCTKYPIIIEFTSDVSFWEHLLVYSWKKSFVWCFRGYI